MTSTGAPLRSLRRGRPRADQAGEDDQRVLDAATTLFLAQGYAGTARSYGYRRGRPHAHC